jgi:hypothetical protein
VKEGCGRSKINPSNYFDIIWCVDKLEKSLYKLVIRLDDHIRKQLMNLKIEDYERTI